MSLLEQFRSFYYRNYPSDMESAIELFSVFGGLDVDIDVTRHKHELIREHILKNYEILHRYVGQLVHYDSAACKLLAALSMGDRRILSSLKRARLNNIKGGNALHFLQELGLLVLERSREEDKRAKKPKLSREEARHRISDKFLFTYPFIRFWFYFVYPHAATIRIGEFQEFFEDFQRRKSSYTSLVFEELSRILLNYYLRDERIDTIGSYWDANTEVDILVITQSRHIYVAECKWTNRKINKKELNKLIDKCNGLEIAPRQLIFFAKRGFSKELYGMQGKELALFSVEDFRNLVKTKPAIFVFPLQPFSAG